MGVVFKTDKGTLVQKKTGYYVKTQGKEIFIGDTLNCGMMNNFCYSGIIELCHDKVKSQQNLDNFNFNNF